MGRKGKGGRKPARVKTAVIRLRAKGYSYREIGRLLGISHSTAYKYANQPKRRKKKTEK